MARFLAGSLLAVGALAALAAPASAQTAHPILQPQYLTLSVLSDSSPSLQVGRGRIAFQNNVQHARVSRELTTRIMPLVNASLASPETAEYSNLRTGRIDKTAFFCGTVASQGADGQVESRRFIARAGAAALETSQNHDAFQAGWRKTGCGF